MADSGLNHYTVCTPQYELWGNPYGFEPPERGCDVVEVQARTKREARVLAVREMRAQGMEWMLDQRSDGRCPFTGLEVINERCEHGKCHCSSCGDECDTCYQEDTGDNDGTA